MYKIVFLDDRADQFSLLGLIEKEAKGRLKVNAMLPMESITESAKKIVSFAPDLVLLDYRLDEKPINEGGIAAYKAGPLAQQLRDMAIEDFNQDFPIFAVSHEDNIRPFYDPDKTAHDVFDGIYVKHEFVNQPQRLAAELISHIEAYKMIIKHFNSANILSSLLKASADDTVALQTQHLQYIGRLKAPHLIAKAIFEDIIARTWLLADENNLIAMLGLKLDENVTESFSKILEIFSNNRIVYEGVFADGYPRWWKGRVRAFIQEECDSTLGDLTSAARVSLIKKCFGLDFAPAISRWTKKDDTYVYFACCSCKNPTEVDFSVSAYEPGLQPLLERKRICWRCIQTGEAEESGFIVDEAEEYIADKIRNGKIRPN